jgi:hypothetical protein
MGDLVIQAVEGHVGFAANEPFRVGHLPIENPIPGFEPVEMPGDITPELFGMVDGLTVKPLVFLHRLDVSLLAEFRRGREEALFLIR